MKKSIMILSLICITTFSYAQQRQQRPEPPTSEEMITKATEELSLTDEQVEQWTEIHEKYESSMNDRSTAQKARETMGEELEATLTEEQLEKFTEMRESQGPPSRRK